MISQMVTNEKVRFGRHIDIEVSYKILQLEVPKLVSILHYLACFQKGMFGSSFEQKHPCPLGVKPYQKKKELLWFETCKCDLDRKT